MEDRLEDGFVGVLQLGVFADHGDVHRSLRMNDRVDQLPPLRELCARLGEAEVNQDDFVQPLFGKDQRQFVDRMIDVLLLDDRMHWHVAEEGELLADIVGKFDFRPADQDVGDDTDLAQLGDTLLGRLGLHFARGLDVGHVGEVDIHHVVAAVLEADLADCLEEGQALDVADRAADFDEDDIDVLLVQRADVGLDLVGDVGNHLDRAAEVIAVAFLLQHFPVDPARGEVTLARSWLAGEPLVVPEIEIGLGAVVGHIDLAVLVGAHRAGVDIEVRINLQHANCQPAADQQPSERS